MARSTNSSKKNITTTKRAEAVKTAPVTKESVTEKDKNVTKVFTIESSGISPALTTAYELNVPMVILKKQTSKILDDDFYQI